MVLVSMFPLYISHNMQENSRNHVNLLFIANPDDSSSDGHYCCIVDLSRLLAGQKFNTKKRLFWCLRCLNAKHSSESLEAHIRFCNELQPTNCVMVSEEKKWMEFRNKRNLLDVPSVIVADFECYSRKIFDKDEPTEGRTVKERRLNPCAFAYFRISRDDSHPSNPVVYCGKDPEDTLLEFLKCMDDEHKRITEILSKPVRLCS